MLAINVREKNDCVILDMEGNIDINASNFIEAVGWVVANKTKDILCNFEKINLIDYVGVSVIAVAYKNVINHNVRMKIYNTPEHVIQLFSVVGLDRIFEYYDSEEDALESVKSDTALSGILEKKLRRRFRRVAIEEPIEYRRKDSQGDFLKGRVINLSAIGVFMIGDEIFPVGEVLKVRLHLFPVPGIIEFDAKVVWVADEEIQPLESGSMGLEFCDISAKLQEEIIKFVEKNIASADM